MHFLQPMVWTSKTLDGWPFTHSFLLLARIKRKPLKGKTYEEIKSTKSITVWCIESDHFFNDNEVWVCQFEGRFTRSFKCSMNDITLLYLVNEDASLELAKSYMYSPIVNLQSLDEFKIRYNLLNLEKGRQITHNADELSLLKSVKFLVCTIVVVFDL